MSTSVSLMNSTVNTLRRDSDIDTTIGKALSEEAHGGQAVIPEIGKEIVSYLDFKSLGRLKSVSSAFNQGPSLWKLANKVVEIEQYVQSKVASLSLEIFQVRNPLQRLTFQFLQDTTSEYQKTEGQDGVDKTSAKMKRALYDYVIAKRVEAGADPEDQDTKTLALMTSNAYAAGGPDAPFDGQWRPFF